MAGIRTCDRESQVQRPNHYTTEQLCPAAKRSFAFYSRTAWSSLGRPGNNNNNDGGGGNEFICNKYYY